MKHQMVAVVLVIGTPLVGCTGAQVLGDYRPAIDPQKTNLVKFETDLGACREIAFAQYEKYRKEALNQAFASALAGALTGALTGAIVGDAYGHGSFGARTGAKLGAVYGVTASAWTADPKAASARVIDRCLTQRGHTILSDLGRG